MADAPEPRQEGQDRHNDHSDLVVPFGAGRAGLGLDLGEDIVNVGGDIGTVPVLLAGAGYVSLAQTALRRRRGGRPHYGQCGSGKTGI